MTALGSGSWAAKEVIEVVVRYSDVSKWSQCSLMAGEGDEIDVGETMVDVRMERRDLRIDICDRIDAISSSSSASSGPCRAFGM